MRLERSTTPGRQPRRGQGLDRGPVARAVADGRLPGRVWFYSNYHCNLTCAYCLTESAPGSARRELPRERMLELGAEAKNLGFTALGVTGGEPFIYSWMPGCLEELAALLPVVALSNGTLFEGPRLEAMRGLGGLPVAIQISLDRPDAQPNDAMRGPDNFRKVIEAIPKLVDLGITVRIATTVERIDDHELERLCALHRALGVDDSDHVVRPVIRRGRAADEGLGIGVTVADLPPELTITADGAYWSPFGPTLRAGRPDTDLLVTRTTRPLATPAQTLLRLVEGRPRGDDTTLNIR